MKINRLLYLCIVLLSAVSIRAGTPAEDFAATLGPDRCAAVVIDLKTGKIVAEHNAGLPLVPASVTKSVTIATTLHKTGPDYRYHTRVYATGPINDGVLEGNLLVVGGGDPSLGADVEPKGTDICGEIIEALRHRGVKEIAGNILTECEIFPAPATPPSWSSGDLSHAYGTGCHGLNFRRNASGKTAVKNPRTVFVSVLGKSLADAGVLVRGEEMASVKHEKELLDHVSPPISEIMRSCMMRSDNLYAEALLRTLALASGKPASTDNGVEIEAAFWKKKGAPMQDVCLIDGSGLSRSNRFPAGFLAYVLKSMAGDEEYVSFFPLAGQEGTVRSLFKNTSLDSYVALKTGTMRGIRCLAGYKLDEDFAPTHVIVIMGNNASGGAAAVNNAAQNMLMQIFYPSNQSE